MRARVAVAIGVLGAAGAIAIGLAAARSSGAHDPVTISVDATHPGRAVPRSFLGLSIEYQSVGPYMGTPAAPNRAFVRLVRALGAAQHSPVALRIGGNSADQSWWNPRRGPRPAGVRFDLGPAWARSLATGQRALGAPVALVLNLALDDPANARALVRGVEAAGLGGPGVRGLEIGNEPDNYAGRRTFRVGPLVVVRPRQRVRYGPAQYVRAAARYVAALGPRRPGAPALAAGGFASERWARTAIPSLLAAVPDRLDELLAHAYALRTCNPTTDPADLRSQLLSDDASRGLVRLLAPYRGRGLPVRVAELNSAVCGGVAGVSDTYAAALWTPDALFALAAAGAGQADVHTWEGSLYAPFVFGRGTRVTVRPLFFGLLLFARAAPAGSRVLPVRLERAGNDVRAWATEGPGRTLRVLVLNRGARDPRRVRVRVGGATRAFAVQRLSAAGLAARDRVTLSARGPRPVAVADGEARIALPPASAALLVGRPPAPTRPGRKNGR